MSNEVILHNGTITLDWADEGRGTYQVQISKGYADFSGTSEYSGTTRASEITHTLKNAGTAGDDKYFWRWRFNDGDGYDNWREASSFIAVSTASESVSVDKWTLINKSDVTDKYELETEPIDWEIADQHFQQVNRRNLKGDLLNEWYATKSKILLDFSRQQYLGTAQKAELQRFYNSHTSFYIARKFEAQDGVNSVYKIWEVLFTEPMQMEKIGLTVSLEEV